jgi:hypothetical protein
LLEVSEARVLPVEEGPTLSLARNEIRSAFFLVANQHPAAAFGWQND